ncbi:unnamed protein product [Penicillium bialowiezense]
MSGLSDSRCEAGPADGPFPIPSVVTPKEGRTEYAGTASCNQAIEAMEGKDGIVEPAQVIAQCFKELGRPAIARGHTQAQKRHNELSKLLSERGASRNFVSLLGTV